MLHRQFFVGHGPHHFQREFDVPVPDVAVVPLFGIRSSVLAHLRFNGTDAMWWHTPPAQAQTNPPDNPEALVQGYAAQLLEHLGRAQP